MKVNLANKWWPTIVLLFLGAYACSQDPLAVGRSQFSGTVLYVQRNSATALEAMVELSSSADKPSELLRVEVDGSSEILVRSAAGNVGAGVLDDIVPGASLSITTDGQEARSLPPLVTALTVEILR